MTRKILNEELHNLNSSHIIRFIKSEEDAMGGTCSTYARAENYTQNFGRET
jgi:hypothetical protein